MDQENEYDKPDYHHESSQEEVITSKRNRAPRPVNQRPKVALFDRWADGNQFGSFNSDED